MKGRSARRAALLVCVAIVSQLLGPGRPVVARPPWSAQVRQPADASDALRCIAFSPYVDGYDPDTGPHPTPDLIDTLLDKGVVQTGFGCIMTYGVLNGLNYVFEAAEARGIEVISEPMSWPSRPSVSPGRLVRRDPSDRSGVCATERRPTTAGSRMDFGRGRIWRGSPDNWLPDSPAAAYRAAKLTVPWEQPAC
jgi:hypothetical protein